MTDHPFVPPSSYCDEDQDLKTSKYDMREFMFKLLVIGDYGVGKTAIIKRYTEGIFTQNYKITIGVDFALKSLQWDENTLITLQLWDIAGHERFGYMTGTYYRHSNAAIIVFDLIRSMTLESVIKWHNDLKEKVLTKDGKPFPVILLANKCDLPGVVIPTEFLSKFCKEHNILAWFFTSAKENINIGEAIQYLVEHVLYIYHEDPYDCRKMNDSRFKLTDEKDETVVRKCC